MAKKKIPWTSRQIIKHNCRRATYRKPNFTESWFGSKIINLYNRNFENLSGQFPEQANNGIIFAACDENYYFEFGKKFVKSALHNSPNQKIHLHIYSPSSQLLLDIENFLSEIGDKNLSFTWDHYNLEVIPESQRAFYFAACRFIRLYQIVAHTNALTLCIDIDGVIRKSLDLKFLQAANFDVGLFLRLSNSSAWRKVLASAVFISPTYNGLCFIKDIAYTIIYLMRKPLTFHIDQLIIFYTWQLYAKKASDFSWLSLSQDLADWEFLDDSYIWSAKGKRKFINEKFIKESFV